MKYFEAVDGVLERLHCEKHLQHPKLWQIKECEAWENQQLETMTRKSAKAFERAESQRKIASTRESLSASYAEVSIYKKIVEQKMKQANVVKEVEETIF